MLARVEACQTQNVLDLDEFADGFYLELLVERVKESDCYISESVYEEIRNLSINEYTSSEAEAEADITVDTANGETHIWIVTFKKDDETWKITGRRSPPWS